nr:hypothetical protein [Tanacetum cinerariifolium]
HVSGNDVGRTNVYVSTSTTTGPGLVNDSLIINEPVMDASLKDTDVLTRRIETRECYEEEDIDCKFFCFPTLLSYTSVPHENNPTIVTCDHMGSNSTYGTNDSIPNVNNGLFNSLKKYLPKAIQSFLEKFLADMSNLADNTFREEQLANKDTSYVPSLDTPIVQS